jgi:hypothetical protein
MAGLLSSLLFLLFTSYIIVVDLLFIYYTCLVSVWSEKFKSDLIDLFDESDYEKFYTSKKNNQSSACALFDVDDGSSSFNNQQVSTIHECSEDSRENIKEYIDLSKYTGNIGLLCSVMLLIGIGFSNYIIESTNSCKDTCMKRIPVLAIISLCYLPMQLMATFNSNWKSVIIVEVLSKLICALSLYYAREDIALENVNVGTAINLTGIWILWIASLYNKQISQVQMFKQREVLMHVSSLEQRKRLMAELCLVNNL